VKNIFSFLVKKLEFSKIMLYFAKVLSIKTNWQPGFLLKRGIMSSSYVYKA